MQGSAMASFIRRWRTAGGALAVIVLVVIAYGSLATVVRPKQWWIVQERPEPLWTLVFAGPFKNEGDCLRALPTINDRAAHPHCVASPTRPGGIPTSPPHGHPHDDDRPK
jgi:hypothetical protein